jgi:tetratricopeptide (TPR) repeat protein
MTIPQLVTRAAMEKKAGNLNEALELYSKAMNIIVKEAMKYALKYEDPLEESDGDKVIREEYMEKVREFYKKDEVVCRISNNMGVIFTEIGNIPAARDMFLQAIDLTPEHIHYPDPIESLEVIISQL